MRENIAIVRNNILIFLSLIFFQFAYADEDWSKYESDSQYFIRDIDIDNDEILDKVISHKPYQGDELLLFKKQGNEYKLVLKSINLSIDGGNIIKDIYPYHEDGYAFIIETIFPHDFNYTKHYIKYDADQKRWLVGKTYLFTTFGKRLDQLFEITECVFKQEDIYLDQLFDGEKKASLKQNPSENEDQFNHECKTVLKPFSEVQ